MTNIFIEWESGAITDMQALHALASDLAEVESELAPLDAEKARLRDCISQVVARFDKPVLIPGFGKIELTAPTVTKSFDKAALESLIQELLFEAPETAQRLARCKTETQRAGSLRITREKGTK